MSNSTNPRQSAGTDGGDGAAQADDRKLAARVEQLRDGLDRAVLGREEVIKAQATQWAEKLDSRTEGRHHQKILAALKVLGFVVDHVVRHDDEAQQRASDARRSAQDAGPEDRFDFARAANAFAQAASAAAGGGTRQDTGRQAEPEHLGEFRNLSDERR